MWPADSTPMTDLQRVFWDTTHVNFRVVDTDLLLDYVGRYLAQLPPSPAIVDAGGGWGRVAIPLATEGYNVDLVDTSEGYMAEGRGIAQEFGVADRIRWVGCDLREYQAATPPNMMLYCESMEYAPTLAEKTALTQRLYRQLAPGGLMIITAVDRLAMANFMIRRLLFWEEIPGMIERGEFIDLKGYLFYPPTASEFDQIIGSLEGEVLDRRTYLHTDSLLLMLGGVVQSSYHSHPDLARRFFEVNRKLMDDPQNSQRGFFHVACVRRP